MPRIAHLPAAVLAIAGVVACHEPVGLSDEGLAPTAAPRAARPVPSGATDPTSTWSIPTTAGLSLRNDGTSEYVDGACGVAAKIFATTEFSGSGDATIQTDPTRRCARRATIVYPSTLDGPTSETLAFRGNLLGLQSPDPATRIAQGATEDRRLILNFELTTLKNPTSGRCGRILFGERTLVDADGNVTGVVAPGSHPLAVTRVDGQTWRVQSKAAPGNLAFCEKTGQNIPLTIDFTVRSATPLPM